jgi:hypothetical protein
VAEDSQLQSCCTLAALLCHSCCTLVQLFKQSYVMPVFTNREAAALFEQEEFQKKVDECKHHPVVAELLERISETESDLKQLETVGGKEKHALLVDSLMQKLEVLKGVLSDAIADPSIFNYKPNSSADGPDEPNLLPDSEGDDFEDSQVPM